MMKKVAPAPDLDFPSLGRPASSGNVDKNVPKSSNFKKKDKKPNNNLNGVVINSHATASKAGNANLKSAADLIFSEKRPSRPKPKLYEDDEIMDTSRPLLPEDDFSSVDAKMAFLKVSQAPGSKVESSIRMVTQLPPKSGPPGFGPPGFGSNKQNNVKVVPAPVKYSFSNPPDFDGRNRKLMNSITAALGGAKSLEFSRFKNLSVQFKKLEVNAGTFIEECSELMNDDDKFESILPELIALLPDIGKQRVTTNHFFSST